MRQATLDFRVTAIIQARMGSSRFPGKVLHNVAGKLILKYLLERLDHCEYLDRIVVATSTDDSDTPIADYCSEEGVDCYRGPLLDVAGRFIEVIDAYQIDSFVRVCADRPLLDQRLVDHGIRTFLQGDFDLVTNVLPPTYPSGQTVEVIRSSAMRHAYLRMRAIEDLEHVTRFFYKNQRDFTIRNFASHEDYSAIHLSIDTSRGMTTFAAIVAKMKRPHWEYDLQQILRMYREVMQAGHHQ